MDAAKKLIPVCLLILLSLACNAMNVLNAGPPPTATASPTPTLEPSPTATPTPTPSPTPPPEARVAKGDQAIFNGDWETAEREYQAALAPDPDEQIQAAAALGMGRSYYLAGKYEQAQAALEGFLEEHGDDPLAAEAHFALAQVYTVLEQHELAAGAYLDYLALRPDLIDSYVYEMRGDALLAAGQYVEAITDYQAALQAPRLSRDLNIDVKIARAYALSGDYATAIVGYQDIYSRSSDDYIKAQMDLLMGRAYTALGQTEQAQAAYLDAVNNFPLAYDSYTALVALVEAGVPVDELNRGLVDYHARQYGVALAAFDRYLQAAPEDPGAGLYYRGLTSRALGGHRQAITDWERVIQDHPDHRFWADAWQQKALTQWYYLDDYVGATQTLLDFVAAAPDHARAGEFLFEAASIAERVERLREAAELWERVVTEYPGSDQAFRAIFLAGISNYRQGEYAAAHEVFQRAQNYAGNNKNRSALFFWSGKCQQALGDQAAARSAWEQAASLDPTGYYSERARDLLQGIAPFTPPLQYDLTFDLQTERVEAEAWMRTVFALPEGTDLSGPGPLAEDPRFIRGNELWRLGLYNEARLEFEDLRGSLQSEVANTYRLANHLYELGLYRPAIFAARHVLTLAGMDNAATLSAPVYFNRLRFGPYYRDLVIAAAQQYDFHPLFLYSVIRQESLFEGFVRSSAGARGLMQIMPATGQEVADNASWPPNYTSEDLYRPLVSVTLGSAYLNRQRRYLNDDPPTPLSESMYAPLAAYNGGPGNSMAWKKLAQDDPDLFLEVIRFEETRNYIRAVYEIFNIYKKIYDRTP